MMEIDEDQAVKCAKGKLTQCLISPCVSLMHDPVF